MSAQAPTGASSPAFADAQQVISYLNQSIDWYRQLGVEEQLASDPADVLFVNDDRQIASQVIRLSFEFGRAEAQNISAQSKDGNAAPGNSRYQAMSQAAARADNQIKETQGEIETLRQKMATARGPARRDLQATLDETQAELDLAQARSEVLHNILQFASSGATGGANNLVSQVQELQRSVPEASANSTGSSDSPQKTTSNLPPQTSTTSRRQQPSGILALITDLFSLSGKIRTLNQTIKSTDALAQTSQSLRAPLVKTLVAAVQRGDVLAKQADTSDPAALQQQRHELDVLTAQFKQISALVLPLSKQGMLLDLYKNSLSRWRDSVKTEYTAEFKSLGLRLIVLTIVLGVFFTLAEVWKRATFRYIQDYRRRSQFLLLRRIVLWFVIATTVAFALATEISSLATFAGLITAGIAVALQNVILAVAGYFFLIGRYGVRMGDRVQISGVTGDVMDIGLIRLHLMELAGAGNSMQPTGRVVVFSNSIVFQPTASFFKQIPGTNFVWHEVKLTLAPESDIHMAESRLLGAVEKVYETYKKEIEHEHRQMQQSLNMRVPIPKPVSRLQLAQGGLEVVIRYPLLLGNAAEVDDHITRELLNALNQRPRLKLVGTGTPNIQQVLDPSQTPGIEQAGAVKTDGKK
jgi:small-conductance mechanosensitive channel